MCRVDGITVNAKSSTERKNSLEFFVRPSAVPVTVICTSPIGAAGGTVTVITAWVCSDGSREAGSKEQVKPAGAIQLSATGPLGCVPGVTTTSKIAACLGATES